MSDFNFLVFSLTVIAIVAIVFGKDDIANKALDVMSATTRNVISSFNDLLKNSKQSGE